MPHHAELPIPIGEASITKLASLIDICRPQAFGDLGHRFAPAGHELGTATKVGRDVVDEEPSRAGATAELPVAQLGHLGALQGTRLERSQAKRYGVGWNDDRRVAGY